MSCDPVVKEREESITERELGIKRVHTIGLYHHAQICACVCGGGNELGTKWIAVSGVVCGVNYHNFL